MKNPWKTQVQGNETRQRDEVWKQKKWERRENTEEPAGESGMVMRKEAIDGSLYGIKVIKWFHTIFQQKKASYSE